jgi:hypothetical protein
MSSAPDSSAAAAPCPANLSYVGGDWAEEQMNHCQREAGHEPPHRERMPAQDRYPAVTIEWADEAWWSE